MAGIDAFLYRLMRKGELSFVKFKGRTVSGVEILSIDATNKILLARGTTVPVDTTTGFAKGCIFIKTDVGAGTCGVYTNDGTITSSDFNALGTVGAASVASTNIEARSLQVDTVSISAVEICTATTIKTLVAAPAAGYYLQFISAALSYKRTTATYGAGGNLTIAYDGGATLTGVGSAATTFGAGADTLSIFQPLSTAALVGTKAAALLLNTAGQFTNPGTAAGTAECTVAYRVLPIET